MPLATPGKINSMKQDIEKKDKLIAVLQQANASLTRAKELEGEGEMLKWCKRMLEGYPERDDVHDLTGRTPLRI